MQLKKKDTCEKLEKKHSLVFFKFKYKFLKKEKQKKSCEIFLICIRLSEKNVYIRFTLKTKQKQNNYYSNISNCLKI